MPPTRSPLAVLMFSLRAALGAVVALLGASGVSLDARAADGNGGLAIVFDGSGSMWGRLGAAPQSKLVIGREALAQALAAAPDAPIGLVSFGRRRGDCSDVELIAPVEAGDRQRILTPLDRLNPRGRGPIALSLRTAAKALEGHDGARHVLIIHDEPDNCSVDACAAAAELKAADPRLFVSTVTLGASPEDARTSACMAQATGGRAFVADTPQDAATAIATAVKLASTERLPLTAPSLAKRPATATEKGGPSRARFTARLGPSGSVLSKGIAWRIWAAASDGATVAESGDANPEVALDRGTYRVEIRAGLVSSVREFEIKDGGVVLVDLALDAGLLRTSAALRRGGAASATTRITLRPDAAPDDAALQPALWIGTPGELIVAPGSYRVVAADGKARGQQRISVQAGQTVHADFSLDAGRVTLAAVAGEGGAALDEVLYRVLEADPDARGGFREVMRSAASPAELVLPAGTYQFVARRGAAEVRERIAVTAGDDVRYTFRIPVGRVIATARIANRAQPPADGIQFRVISSDANVEPIETSAVEADLYLPAGRYRLEARSGAANAAIIRDIEVKAGIEQKLQLTIPAGEVELRPAEGRSGLALAEAFWEISDMQNCVVLRTVQPRPKVLLAEGRYTARLSAKTRRFEKAFEVKAGAPALTVTLGDE